MVYKRPPPDIDGGFRVFLRQFLTASLYLSSTKALGEPTYLCELVPLIAELELCGYIKVERKGRGRGEGVDFYIYPIDPVERKALLDALKDLIV
jgi:hypothetical protein